MRSNAALTAIGLSAVLACGGSIDASGAPGWRERTVLALTNAIRISPADWKERWSGGGLGDALGAHYPPVPPVRWSAGLGHSAREHSEDMARTPCFQHDSCDGTRWSDRIRRYYTLSGAIGEDIAAGYGSPAAAVYGWICDGAAGACCADGGGCDGHRSNIMNGDWQAMGAGWASGGGYGQYWTQDLGGKIDALALPLVDGSHLVDGTVRFFANIWADETPRSVSVLLAGATLPMQSALGSAARGTWAVEVPAAPTCRTYAFALVDAAGRSWRYPVTGWLSTYGEGTCTEGP